MSNHRQITMPSWLKVKHIWTHGFLIGLTLGAIWFFAFYFIAKTPSFPTSEENASRPFAKEDPEKTLPADSKISPLLPQNPVDSLEPQLVWIFNGIKETNLKKNLAGLLDFYSLNFPQLPKKAQSIKKSWKQYDYQRMDFKIHEIKFLSEDSMVAWVTWDVSLKNLATRKINDISKTYQVTFVRESGQWHIIGLKNALW